jgi:hypothetical protein
VTSVDVVLKRLRERYVDGPPNVPATGAQVAEAEARLGFAIPLSLRRFYIDFSNGGFGPAFGVYGVGEGAHMDLEGLDLVGQYSEHRRPSGSTTITEVDPEYSLWSEGWPERILPLTAPAGTLSFALDALPGEVLSADGNEIAPGMTYLEWFQRAAPTVEAWLNRWLNGEELPVAPTGPLAGS